VTPFVDVLVTAMFVGLGAGLHRLWRDDRDAFPWPQPSNRIEYRNIRVIDPVPALYDWADTEVDA
jgi:hypothetical protein